MATTIDWLLEPKNPGVRFLALRDLVGLPDGDPELEAARRDAYARGPIGRILDHQNPEGWWEAPGAAYGPKYRSTPWSILILAQLGARALDDERIARGCKYLLDQNFSGAGYLGMDGPAENTADCFQGNTLFALTAMGFEDARLDTAYDWMARSVTGEGVAPAEDINNPVRYQQVKVGPLFRCLINYGLSCGWGGVKVMQAFSVLPVELRTPVIRRGIDAGATYMLDNDPAGIGYPAGGGTTSLWWTNFGFPVTYPADIIQNVDALVRLGYGDDARLQPALDLIRSKADEQGRWVQSRDYGSQLYLSFGVRGKPSKWVTWRALRVLKGVEQLAMA